ncbi:MAG: DUF2461 domain-containing protein [candidate division SR1 bacterium]|nr:DUF2461 domain-containing protein [candidate division SR1 bacterium]
MLQDYIHFLHNLSLNNNKLWFDSHKDHYLELQKEYEAFVDGMIVEIHKIDNTIQFLTRRETMFRIYRDARFSFGRDKTPYKTWISCIFSPNGKKADEPGYFFRLNGKGELTVGGGLWTPAPEKLLIVRKNLSIDSKNLEKVLTRSDIIKHFGQIGDNKVSRPPRGFLKDDPNIELIRQKSITLIKNIHFIGDYEDLKKELIKNYEILYPFILVLRDLIIERYE